MGDTGIIHFRELRVYKQAFSTAMRLFELSESWPKEEKYSLTDQIRRSSRSVCANIAESWCKRRYTAHFISKLSDADTELAETQSWLDFALNCRYISEEEYRRLDDECRKTSGGLVRMMSEPEKWCGPANMLKEDTVEYESSD